MPLHFQDAIDIYKADHTLKLVKPAKSSYFEVLRTKLNWGRR
jgi:NAD kinase